MQKNATIAIFDGWKLINGDPKIICPSCDEGKVPSGWCICDQKNDRFQKDGKIVSATYFQYHTSWDWLMPVVEKIGDIVAKQDGITIADHEYGLEPFAIIRRMLYTPILTVHNDVYLFITWYQNQQKQNDDTGRITETQI